ncbi:MAG: peptide ABC transporter substrate-binding protein, partial [Opitutaceae bacterium]
MLKRLCSPVLFFILTVGALVSGCGKKDSAPTPASPSSANAAPQILYYGNHGEPQDLDLQVLTGIPEHHLSVALSEGLVSEDPRDLHPVPGVASSWDVSPDGLVYTFHLRPDAKWSNGEPLTATDFVRSYQRILTPSLTAEYAYMLYNYIVGAKDYYDGKLTDFARVGVKAIDPQTLQLTLLQPTPYILNAMNHYAWFPVPTSVIAKFDGLAKKGTAWTRPENFVSNGPFVLKEWRPHQKIVVTRSPTYWDRANVKLDEIHFYPVDNLDVEERMFRTGQLHLTAEVPVAKIDTYRKNNPEALRID